MSDQTPKRDEDSALAALDAFDEGQVAATKGLPRTANPYPPGDSWGVPMTYQMWDDGYDMMKVKERREEIATLTARCEALEQDRNDFRDEVHTLAKACTDTALERDALRVRCEALTAERDRLLAEKQADKDSFDNALAQFSAGYTQALDDAVKGTKP